MAVAYASHSTGNDNTTTVTITKPSGLAVGDLMVSVCGAEQNGVNINIPAGWGTVVTKAQTNGRCTISYKVADSSDVAASNFVFTSSIGKILGIIYRITGADVTHIQSADSGSISGTPTHNPYSNPAVVIVAACATDISSQHNFSGYSVSGGDSPTMTERFDDGVTGADAVSIGVADGSYASLSNITAYSISAIGGSPDDFDIFLVTIPGVTNASGTVALHSADADFFAPTASSGTTGTNALLSADADFFSTSGESIVPTVWTPITKS